MVKNIIFSLVVSVTAAVILSGCATPAYDVEAYLSPKLKDKFQIYPSVEMDIVGVNTQTAEYFDSVPVADYFTPGNSLRGGTDHATLHFSEDNLAPKILTHNNPIWKLFGKKDADQLCLLINLPITENALSKKDPRRIMIPLETNWFSHNRRFFEITPSGLIQLKTRPENIPLKIQEDGKSSQGERQ